eukprot:TRINITY_DN5370_c0_g3_i2.p1 TRINITY_DN5370_c0_g3~~TRINITY_DN5370_c0_g3_i2.p1  ORF type:complete len:296 (+),score=34.83 TRINITY_DN5370_c0_g3_i2:65-952(+)
MAKGAALRRKPAAAIVRKMAMKKQGSKAAAKGKPKKRAGSGSTKARRSSWPLQKSDKSDSGFHCLFFGRTQRPTHVVVLLHGLNDNAKSCSQGVVNIWKRGLPNALFVVPESPEQTTWSTEDNPGYTWTSFTGMSPFEACHRFGTQSTQFAESIQRFHRSIASRCSALEKWLDNLLAKHRLSYDNLVISGFSQGALLSVVIGARRNALGTIVCGGVPYAGFFQVKSLMPKKSASKFCSVNGTKDEFVERKALEELLSPYDCEWTWDKGVGHDFPDKWYRVELKWMKQLFAQQKKG